MERANDITGKYIWLAGCLILTCILITIGISQLNTSKQTSASVNARIQDINNAINEDSVMMYDGEEVEGSTVLNFFKKNLGDYDTGDTAPMSITIVLKTKTTTYYNGSALDSLKSSSDPQYIKPTWIFVGAVTKNKNGIITNITFNQK